MTGLQQQQAEPQTAEALRTRVRATWTAGDFGRIAVGFESGAAEFIERLKLAPGERVLDVACGTGNLALPAARGGARVSAIDIAPALVEQLAGRAGAEGLGVDARVGDAEALPFADDSFDTVVTMFGAMFAAHPQQAANELLRVTRPGGRIAMANWTPEGFVGRMLKLTVGYVPPPAGGSCGFAACNRSECGIIALLLLRHQALPAHHSASRHHRRSKREVRAFPAFHTKVPRRLNAISRCRRTHPPADKTCPARPGLRADRRVRASLVARVRAPALPA